VKFAIGGCCLFLLNLCLWNFVTAQQFDSYCGAEELMSHREKENPLLRQEKEIFNRFVKKNPSSPLKTAGDVLYAIPVVIHIIHEGGAENISEEQVLSQMAVLNEAFQMIPGSPGDSSGANP